MSTSAATRTALLEDADYWRGPPADVGGGWPHKEWQHFVIFGGEWTILFNLNLDGTGAARTITILDREGWQGHVAHCRNPRFRPGRLDATFDQAGMRWRDGRYEIWQHGTGVRLEGVLEPISTPSLTHNIHLGPGAHLSWCLIPRLLASGWFEVDGQRVPFEGRLAYHDHNWGRFGWGGDFSWDWGCAVPDDLASPWTVIFARMNDRARHRTTATSVFLMKDGRHVRYFRNAEVRFETEGQMAPRPSGRVPAAAALLVPDEDHDVPRWTRFEASKGEDTLSGQVEARRRGQVLIPADNDLCRIVRLNEVHTRVRVEGRIADERVHFEGPGVLEVVRG
ncbi:MAG: hypothetical protein ABJE95_23540 [Byssovorax sp.]